MDSNISKILRRNYVDGVLHTHVSMIEPKGSFLLNREDLEELWNSFCSIMENDKNAGIFGIGETPQFYSPIIGDIDIKIKEEHIDPEILKLIKDETDIHLYKPKHVKQIVEIYQSILRQIVEDCTDTHLTCCLLEKKIYTVDKKGVLYYKNGFHIHFPYIFLSKTDQENYFNPRILEAVKELEVFEDLGVEDSSKIIDTGICTKPWLLYGCKKEVSDPYLLTKVYDSDLNEITLEEGFKYYQIFDINENLIDIRGKVKYYLPRILSISLYGRQASELKSGLECMVKQRQAFKNKNNTQRENLKTTVEENLKISEKLLPMLSQHRSEEHDEWMTIGWILYNISDGCQEGLDQWIDFSSKDETNFDEDECIQRWDKMSKGNYTIGTLKFYAKNDNPDMYKEFVKEQGLKHIKSSLDGSHNDIAKLLFTEYGTDFVCASVANKTWYQFMGNHWEEIEEGVFLREKISSEIVEKYGKLGGDYFAKMAGSDGNDEKTYRSMIDQVKKLIKLLKSTPFKKNVMAEAADIFFNKNFKNKLDTNPFLFAFKNGVYDLKTNTFRSGRPEDYLSKTAPISYINFTEDDERVQSVRDFLEKVFPDKSVRKYFLDTTSDVFVGGNHQKIGIFWTGEGDNAKSVTQTILEKMLGDYAIKISTSLITGKKGGLGSAAPELSRAGGGVRWAVLEEPDPDEEINGGIFKSLTGNDSYWARDLFEKGKSTREIVPLFMLLFICNRLPRFRGGTTDKAIWNRTRVIPFEATFVRTGEEVPTTYEEQLKEKRFPMDTEFGKKIPSLLEPFAWILLEHRKSILGKERIEPEKVKAATAMYRKQNDIYRQFVEERIIEDKTYIKIDELYDDFKVWYKNGNPGSAIPGKEQIKEYFTKLWGEPAPGVKWYGYRVRTLDDDVLEGNAIVLDENDLVEYSENNPLL